MYKSLERYIQFLQSKGELIRIREFVDPVLQIAEIADRVSKSPHGGKALLFENTGTNFPALINAFGSDKRIAYALGANNINDISKGINNLLKTLTTPMNSMRDKLKLLPTLKRAVGWMPKIVGAKGKCQEIIIRKPDLGILPVLQCWPYDGGRFFTLPLVHTKDAETGIRNTGMYRMQIFDKNTTGMHWHKHKTGARHYEQYKAQGRLMPVAVALGGDPVYTWCATAPLPDNIDEYLLAGYLRNKRVELVHCISHDIEVPADADIVIEGYVDPAEDLLIEGPFGDHTGFYSLEDLYPRFHVTCITHRRNAVYPATIVGIPPHEDAYIAKASERIFLEPIRFAISPEVEDIHMPKVGIAHNIAVVKIKKSYPGQAIKVAHALWGAGQMMFCKVIVVVGDNIDTHDYNEVLKAVAMRWNPQTDTHFSKGILDVLDHAAQVMGYGGKMCIDATEKLPEELCQGKNNVQCGELIKFYHKSDKPRTNARIVITFDDNVDLTDIETCVWLAGNNIDISRDCSIENDMLLIDATIKHKGYKGFNRPFPNVLCSSTETIKQIDEMWNILKIGDFIASPSLRYQKLVQLGKAAIDE
ncbi:MAG: menaquinone biosynthesis decarboxylase [Prevotellaceae bacterium]|jgi:4-hydroxy-3-polyprenylbenzoate decarboxylase|nr:menaquinone biosynthesis decarboxylase [Prevotellaceae bacterium]